MLSEEKNRLLTEVGPGKPMGELLRRYWHPVAGTSEFERMPVKAVRLFGEDLVLYKDLGGRYGLLDRHCPHRGADLSYGYVEPEGLRCNYHGWQYDHGGRCLAQPYEDMQDPAGTLRRNTRVKAYPVREKAGLLWAYLGPAPAPELPDWDLFNAPNGFAQAVFSEVPCNWFQCQENSIDPVHFEWMHNNWNVRLRGDHGPYVPTHVKVEFEEFEYGFVYKRLREGESEDSPMWTIGRVALWPNGFYLGHHFEWRVPIDDHNTLSVLWVLSKIPKEREPFVQERIPSWHGPIKDPATGRWITSHVDNQDFVAWVGQGAIADRTRERLGRSDKGVVMMRLRFFEQLEALQEGRELKGTIRDPALNRNVVLPSVCREEMLNGVPLAELEHHPILGGMLQDFFFQAGQPDEVREAYEQAVGRKTRGEKFFKLHEGGSFAHKGE